MHLCLEISTTIDDYDIMESGFVLSQIYSMVNQTVEITVLSVYFLGWIIPHAAIRMHSALGGQFHKAMPLTLVWCKWQNPLKLRNLYSSQWLSQESNRQPGLVLKQYQTRACGVFTGFPATGLSHKRYIMHISGAEPIAWAPSCSQRDVFPRGSSGVIAGL